MNIRLHIFHTGICAKFLKLRCKRFKSYLFDNQSLTFRIALIGKLQNIQKKNRQLWIGLARKLKIFILLILSKTFEKSAIVNLPFHILKLLDKKFTLF